MWKTKPADRAESLIALRARHQSMRIAEEVLRGGGIDVEWFNCPACGAELDAHDTHTAARFRCSVCEALIDLPPHLRNVVSTRLPADANQHLDGPPPPVPVRAIPVPGRPLRQPEVRLDPPPTWAIAFCLIWLAVAVAAVARMISQLM